MKNVRLIRSTVSVSKAKSKPKLSSTLSREEGPGIPIHEWLNNTERMVDMPLPTTNTQHLQLHAEQMQRMYNQTTQIARTMTAQDFLIPQPVRAELVAQDAAALRWATNHIAEVAEIAPTEAVDLDIIDEDLDE